MDLLTRYDSHQRKSAVRSITRRKSLLDFHFRLTGILKREEEAAQLNWSGYLMIFLVLVAFSFSVYAMRQSLGSHAVNPLEVFSVENRPPRSFISSPEQK